MINPRTSQEEPVFKPKEIPAQIRAGLAAARALNTADQKKKGWKVIPNPPTLAQWLEDHPDFKDYDPQDDFSGEVNDRNKAAKPNAKSRASFADNTMTSNTPRRARRGAHNREYSDDKVNPAYRRQQELLKMSQQGQQSVSVIHQVR
jgi:hypothetical protein